MVTLTKAEEKIMMILWDIEKGFIKDILDQYPDPKPPYNSVSTIVRVLVQKEIVGFTAYGNSHQYHPLISKDIYSKGQLSRLVKDYYDNSLSQVVNFFSESKKLDEKELDEAMKMLKDLKKKKNG
ncbi:MULTISPECIES: BlaI/MecI/CopY family transcriptional regulator [unclassified Imperialibacter]|uniref:BlaI/MecI/CopY family transcriptional regulator n=1 Tax=unclassified Imperialibacter TaxID=2629706 RepID=UPI0012559D7E|nr:MULTISPECIES: BlaI/MecI/CopY family transcriptional regulator [unclassified Imperialibacter]CAD5282027.1 Transcriptional regulator [Imperialibacter sp. 89]CAD5287556.1 Transcriptional regulator [Imperialibacter sp. 75]VVT30796.1 Transcriptional regulator [Imperialibacter sp. EC-SDR9]